jgi:hypothetical protein
MSQQIELEQLHGGDDVPVAGAVNRWAIYGA